MKFENFYVLVSSLWDTFVVFILTYLYSPESLRYFYIVIPMNILLFYWILSKNEYVRDKKKSASDSSIALGIFLLYSLIVFSIVKESFRTNFLVYSLPFLILEFILILLYRKYYLPAEVKTRNEKPE